MISNHRLTIHLNQRSGNSILLKKNLVIVSLLLVEGGEPIKLTGIMTTNGKTKKIVVSV